MRSAFCCALLPMLLSMKSSGQPDVASLLKVLSKAPQDSGRVMSLQTIGDAYLELGEFEQSVRYVNEALELARRLGDRRGEGEVLHQLGVIRYYEGNSLQALEHWERAVVIKAERRDPLGVNDARMNMGNRFMKVHRSNQVRYVSKYLDKPGAIASRRSRPSVMRTWRPAACPIHSWDRRPMWSGPRSRCRPS
ncbi:MAG: tetratricopeptide repeat protein [Flavobacteriales bacterium]|nr:tetratricopeptide repeat protein [Flavobacteriales bacterium]MBK9289217.1 tetratricopeptide repeat protein [Flavobacteriales bacterium]MBL0036730.1 tetratricopeptide repeat protein [Flavobacteriales bacterium]